MNVREQAFHILYEVENGGKSHLLMQEAYVKHPEYTGKDRRFLTRLVQGTLENQIFLDDRIARKASVPPAKQKPAIRVILRMGAFQILFLDRVPASAAVNEAVKLTGKLRMKGLTGFVNGVLRAVAREKNWPAVPPSVRYSIPEWIAGRWQREYGQEKTERMLASFQDEKRLICRPLIREDAEAVKKSLEDCGISVFPAPFPAGAWRLSGVEGLEELPAFREGKILIQDSTSMLVSELASLPADAKVLDVCAAPGGKSIGVASRLGPEARVISCDVSEAKISLIEENRRRCGITNLTARVQDAREFVPEWENRMDLVLADLPCSGLGVLGRKPEIRYRVQEEDIFALASLQREILANVGRYVKPGGFMIYSTCTVTSEENRENRRFILERLPFEPETVENPLPDDPELAESAKEGWLQLLPGAHPCDGFFISVFRKKE